MNKTNKTNVKQIIVSNPKAKSFKVINTTGYSFKDLFQTVAIYSKNFKVDVVYV